MIKVNDDLFGILLQFLELFVEFIFVHVLSSQIVFKKNIIVVIGS